MKAPLTISAAARRLEKSEATIRRLVDCGAIAAIRLANGMRLLDAASVEQFAQAKQRITRISPTTL